MAEALLDSDCLWCFQELKDAVTLGCEHSFCSRCLWEFWGERTGNCPNCTRRSSKLLPLSFALKKEPTQTESLKEEVKSSVKQKESSEEQEVRGKRPKNTSDKPDAQGKERPSEIKRLEEKKKRTENLKKQCEDLLQHVEQQAQICEDQIEEQINWFHQILNQEKELHLSMLRKEKAEKTRRIQLELKDLEHRLTSVSDELQASEQKLKSESLEPQRLQTDEPDPPQWSGLLIDQAKVLGNLGYRMWRKVGTFVKHSPVILDPNTAYRHLHLSKDLTRVRQKYREQEIPLNVERFTSQSSVLGSEGFSSGTHQWTVEVGDHPQWRIGLVKESADRTAPLDTLPENGFWCLMHRHGQYLDFTGKTVTLSKHPERIMVELEYETGRVSFYDPKDMTLICAHRDTFIERLFPYFSLGPARGAFAPNRIQLCHNDPQVSLPPLTFGRRLSSVSQTPDPMTSDPYMYPFSPETPGRVLRPDRSQTMSRTIPHMPPYGPPFMPPYSVFSSSDQSLKSFFGMPVQRSVSKPPDDPFFGSLFSPSSGRHTVIRLPAAPAVNVPPDSKRPSLSSMSTKPPTTAADQGTRLSHILKSRSFHWDLPQTKTTKSSETESTTRSEGPEEDAP